jgi:hypothetical protein
MLMTGDVSCAVLNWAADREGRSRLRVVLAPFVVGDVKELMSSPFAEGPAEEKFDDPF